MIIFNIREKSTLGHKEITKNKEKHYLIIRLMITFDKRINKTAIPCILTKDFKIYEAKTDRNKKNKRKSHNYY